MLIDFEMVIAESPYTYGETMHRYWQKGHTFINVEHDIVPYPGALQAIDECGYNFCGYDYPIGYAGVLGPGRGSALGCVKFGASLMRDYPDLSDDWPTTPWNALDAKIFLSLKGKADEFPAQTRWTHFVWHEHYPPVSHLHRMKGLDDPAEIR